jgi:hypothetical protein
VNSVTLAPAIGLPVTASETTPLMAAVSLSGACGAGGVVWPPAPARQPIASAITATLLVQTPHRMFTSAWRVLS